MHLAHTNSAVSGLVDTVHVCTCLLIEFPVLNLQMCNSCAETLPVTVKTDRNKDLGS